MPIKKADKTLNKKELIIEFLTLNPNAKTTVISKLIGNSDRRTRVILKEMIEDGVLEADVSNRNRIYMLKR